MKKWVALSTVCLALAAAPLAHAETPALPAVETPPPPPPSLVPGANALSLQGLNGDGAIGAALNDFSRHIVLEVPAQPALDDGLSETAFRKSDEPAALIAHRLKRLAKRGASASRQTMRLEDVLDGFEAVISKALTRSRETIDDGGRLTRTHLPTDHEARIEMRAALKGLTISDPLANRLKSDTASLVERLKALPRDPKDEPDLSRDVALSIQARIERLTAEIEAKATPERPMRQANWLEAARESLDTHVTELETAAQRVDWQNRAITVDARMLLNLIRLQTAQSLLYAKDLERFADRVHSFPLADHKALAARLAATLDTLESRAGWQTAEADLSTAFTREVETANAIAQDFGFTLVGDHRSDLPKQVSLCVENGDASATPDTIYRINTILNFTFGRQRDFPVTQISRGPSIAEPNAPRIYSDGYKPRCNTIALPAHFDGDIADHLKVITQTALARMTHHLARAEMLARHANLIHDLAARATRTRSDLVVFRETLKSEPKILARYGEEIRCSARSNARIVGEGTVRVGFNVSKSGRVSDMEITDESQLKSKARGLERSLRSAFRCEPYEPFEIDGDTIEARKHLSVTLSP